MSRSQRSDPPSKDRCQEEGTPRGRCHNHRRKGDVYCYRHLKGARLIDLVAVAAKEAYDRLELSTHDDPNRASVDLAGTVLLESVKAVIQRYSGDECSLCGGPAVKCAIRHAQGRSCD